MSEHLVTERSKDPAQPVLRTMHGPSALAPVAAGCANACPGCTCVPVPDFERSDRNG
ncbi:hypothetical protein LX81_04095 [Palleronia aestuarii]|uniref:Uncharacterized protein n=1 Tax=Palleronia aestuarii TaxID=568105 RepID=A0A2W7MSI1_9RHOB|nr:hypothetical protein LX81_04095 [Palleronia aestuarii]